MAAIDTIKKHLTNLGYGNQLKERNDKKWLIEVIAEKDRLQTYKDIEKQLKEKGVDGIYIDDPDTVKDTFGKSVPSTVGAILFPKTPFQDVALKVGKPVGGGGPSIAQHESFSAFCIASVLKDKKSDFSLNALKNASRLVLSSENDIEKLFNEKITQEWKDSGKMQAQEFFRNYKGLAGKDDYIIERQKEGPITAYLYKQANKFLKDLEKNATLKLFANIQLDKWNPGDIWLVHNSVETKYFEGCKTIKKLNEKILELFLVKKLIPISLKQVKGTGKVPYEVSNDGNTNFYGKYVDHDLGEKGGFSFNNIQSNLHYEVINTKTSKGTAVVRPFTKEDISAEIKGEAAAGGKAGRSFINIVLKSMKKEPVLGYKEADKIIKDGNGYETLLAIVLQTKFARALPKTISEFMKKTMSKYKSNVQQKDFLRAKLQSADFCLRLEQLKKTELDELVDKTIAYASSTIKQVSSVFIKIGK